MEYVVKNRLAYLALGGNKPSPAGPPQQTIIAALQALVGDSVRLLAVSRFFRTPAYPPGSGPEYVNAAACVATSLPAEALLTRLHAVEASFARVRQQRWAARTLDLDLIGIGQEVLPDAATVQSWIDLGPEQQRRKTPAELLLPHPRLQDRAFVLIPLAEIAPAWRHPLSGLNVADMVKALPEAAKAGISAF